MEKFEQIPDGEFIFGALFVIANKMDTLLERTLNKHNITSKQWFLLLVLFNLFEKPPTIKEVAKEMGTSHQNVKQLALKLEQKGMLKLEKDKKDLRVTRILLAKKSYDFWKATEKDGNQFMNAFYKNIEKNNLQDFRSFISTLMLNLKDMEEGRDLCI